MPPKPATFTVMALVGPGEKELTRFNDLLSALWYYEPGVSRVVLVDDPAEPRDLASLLPKPPATCSLEIIPNPRSRNAQKLTLVLSPGVLAGLEQAAKGDPGRYVLKLDSDALIVGPFHDRLSRFIEQHPDAGIVGACHFTPRGEPRDGSYQARVFGGCAKWLVSHEDRKVCGRRKRFPSRISELRTMRLARRAIDNGYKLGEHVQGGGYAVTARCVNAMKSQGLFADLNAWVETFASEDGVVSLYARAVGTTLVDHVGENDVFGVTYRGLPFTLEEIVRRNYAIIHSLKNDPHATEEQIRDYFANRRAGGNAA